MPDLFKHAAKLNGRYQKNFRHYEYPDKNAIANGQDVQFLPPAYFMQNVIYYILHPCQHFFIYKTWFTFSDSYPFFDPDPVIKYKAGSKFFCPLAGYRPGLVIKKQRPDYQPGKSNGKNRLVTPNRKLRFALPVSAKIFSISLNYFDILLNNIIHPAGVDNGNNIMVVVAIMTNIFDRRVWF